MNPSLYAGHSFRIGAATSAAAAGIPAHMVQALGCWSSDAFKFYTRSSRDSLAKGLSHAGRLPLMLTLPFFIFDIHYPLCPHIHVYPMLHCLFIYPMINWSRRPSSPHVYLSLSLSMHYMLWLTCLCLHSSNTLFLYILKD